jgi:putative addiction module component (TIGR02574 family)
MKTLESIISDAMLLPEDQRVTLAHQLLDSVESADPDVEAAWDKEIRERLRQFDAGEVKGIPGEEVFREIRERLKG